MSLHQLAAAWNGFFFQPIPVYSIALFRIVFACIMLIDAFFVLAHAREYLGPDGLIEYDRYRQRNVGRALSLFFYLPPTMRSVHWVLGLHIVSIIFLLIGLFTPLSALIAFVTLRSIVNRNPEVCNGGDNVARIMCFFLIFAPTGKAYSLDALLFHPAAHILAQAPWALRLMQIQVSVIYINAAYWKLRGVTYRNGTAIYYSTISEFYRRFSVPRLFLRKPIVHTLTWGTLALEFSLGSAIWVQEFRAPLVALGIAFHLVIELVLNVHLFGWYMIACLMLFIDPNQIMRIF